MGMHSSSSTSRTPRLECLQHGLLAASLRSSLTCRLYLSSENPKVLGFGLGFGVGLGFGGKWGKFEIAPHLA